MGEKGKLFEGTGSPHRIHCKMSSMGTSLQTSEQKPVERELENALSTSGLLSSRRELGQFLTPTYIADLMASFFNTVPETIELLDAGAGEGALTAALVTRLSRAKLKPKKIEVTAYEVDYRVIEPLRLKLDRSRQECDQAGIEFSSKIINEDFIRSVVPILRADLFSPEKVSFNAAIVNPPYRKLRSDSTARLLLRSVGIETSNFYAAFVTLISRLLMPGGELVAITPRSFCNGPYFRSFRRELLQSMLIRRLHLFDLRSAAFRKDKVLQENIIIHAVKGIDEKSDVILSNSSGQPNGLIVERRVHYDDIVSPADPEQFVHIGIHQSHSCSSLNSLAGTLNDLNVSVSTGRVVDFRAKRFLRQDPTAKTAPLIYPTHFNGGFVTWPKETSRKPNAILVSEHTRDLLVPSGFYVLVKRFSSKEERKRIVACVYDPHQIRATWVGLEIHLNYFHCEGKGLSADLALGLAAFLNSTTVDLYFRQFSGHTQVNAADLRKLKYPSAQALNDLGRKISYPINQDELDKLIDKELFYANQ